jgi:lipopolysaccharide biosynthesis protein
MSRSPVSSRRTLIPRNVSVHVESSNYTMGSGDRVAFVASYSSEPRVTLSLSRLIDDLRRLDYEVVLIRASEDKQELIWPDTQRRDLVVLRKPNVGYDFGSWAVGMDRHRSLLSRPYVLLVNDSLAGPFSDLGGLIRDFESSTCDVWGATRSRQLLPHLQSYLLGFKRGVLLDRPIRTFWNHLPVETEKSRIVEAYEMAFARLLFSEGYTTEAFIEPEQIESGDQNPSLDGWRQLLDLGFPFIKRTIITDPSLVGDGTSIESVVRARYDTDLADWL